MYVHAVFISANTIHQIVYLLTEGANGTHFHGKDIFFYH